jgi:hypothetical protein
MRVFDQSSIDVRLRTTCNCTPLSELCKNDMKLPVAKDVNYQQIE